VKVPFAYNLSLWNMDAVNTIDLNKADSLDIDEAIMKAEQSFGVRFNDDDFKKVTNFEELCEVVICKIEASGEHVNDCTSQQAFYKLRHSISSVLHINKNNLYLNTELNEILPRKNRRKNVQALEQMMGFKLNLLRPPKWLSTTLGLILLASFVLIFIKWKAGIPAFASTLAVLKLIAKYAKTFDVKTLGEAAEKLTKENYRQSRRNPETINKAELTEKVKALFAEELA
jgi:hypothetical protein